jgi:hypothetical protein
MKKEKKAKASAEEAGQESAVVGEETESVSGETPPNELHEPFWSVVSFEGRIASNLTYDARALHRHERRCSADRSSVNARPFGKRNSYADYIGQIGRPGTTCRDH